MIRGIAGLVSTNGTPVDADHVERMLTAMGKRTDKIHGLYQSRLAAFGLGGPVSDTWPIKCSGANLVSIADLRLDNRNELAEILGCNASDDAVLSNAYQTWGADCVTHIHGDFSFAFWDEDKSELFLARDRFGVRPLVYTIGDGWFAFASEVKALLALPEVARESPELRIAEFLSGRMPQVSETMFTTIHRLPGGHQMVVRAGSNEATPAPYWTWQLPPQTISTTPHTTLAELFTDAVNRRAPKDSPTAVTLSGGLDSSAVAATMAKYRGHGDPPVSTFSLVFDKYPDLSERSYIQSLLDLGSYDPHFLDLETEDPFENFSELLSRQDGLFQTGGLGMGRSLLEGLPPGTVVLDGHGGDEVISHGYERLDELAEQGRWRQFWTEVKGASLMAGANPIRALVDFYALYGRGGWLVKKLLKRFARRSDLASAAPSILSDRLATKLAGSAADSVDGGPRPSARAKHMAVLGWPGQQHVLEVLDRDAAGRGHEARSPFWDERLIEFMLSVPASEKLKGGHTRRIMRDAMADRLPDLIRWRQDKHDFNHHFARGLKSSPAASAQRFQDEADRLSRYMNLPVIASARERIIQSGANADGNDVNILWRATAVAEWLSYADQNGIRVVE
ncbi:asparagine synthetase B family protein [Brevundimonas variabilis]|uniref:asparagine synthase (glutamine-hydrolyzing) n=1 Tax=Brevundimonas variabilis TaxID=74312 RepID=A0A7W9CIY8_9CAUL|nr:asparagine synthase-related protein [Brevundimonas variabilis]MBB5746344.1 asparagine synthase (glutamine-hydrolyzing) [Brevundimonas variabilis]